MATPQLRYCACRCHAHLWAEHRSHLQHDEAGFHVYRAAQDARSDTPWAATDDVVEAAMACRECVDQQCPALCSTKPVPIIPRPITPPVIPGGPDATACTEDPDDGN